MKKLVNKNTKKKEITPEQYQEVIKKLLKDLESCNCNIDEWYGDKTGSFKEIIKEAGYEWVYEQ